MRLSFLVENSVGPVVETRWGRDDGMWHNFLKRWQTLESDTPDRLWIIALLLCKYRDLKQIAVSSVAQSFPTLCDPIDCSTPGFPVHHQLPEIAQAHVHWVGDAIQPSHPLFSPSPAAFNLSQHEGLFQWVSSSHQVSKVLELQHQSFQWMFRTSFGIDWF